MPINKIKIFPAIGISRIGNSPSFFIGPEIPGDRNSPEGGYKDSQCRVKRQAARFRLFGYDGDVLEREITSVDAEITWTAELANKKGSWKLFIGPNESPTDRNDSVTDRDSLDIVPGEKTLTGPNRSADFNTGQFLGEIVALGEMRTDADGRLLIIGGNGISGSVPAGERLYTYANNDKWYDDVSDGPIRASVILNGEVTAIVAEPAWVICAPPNYAPPIDSITTLYDVLLQVAVEGD